MNKLNLPKLPRLSKEEREKNLKALDNLALLADAFKQPPTLEERVERLEDEIEVINSFLNI